MTSRRALPPSGHDAQTVLSRLRDLRTDDVAWRDGRVWSLVFYPGDEASAVGKAAYEAFYSENALNPSAFPSLRMMEAEIVSMTATLLGGDDDVVGNMTTGGTESILMAMKTAREWGRENRKLSGEPEVILPTTAHPAFEKAAHYFGLTTIRVPVTERYRADIRAMKKAITRNTVMLVGSAPQYAQGVVDPIAEIARLARKKKLLCHVDACIGGFMLPFVRELGSPVPDFDFAVPGVTSISVDLHKYAYTAKGASVILYREPSLRRHQYFAFTDWPGGIYASPTMTGTRSGGVIASAWATLHFLGHDGYLEIAREVMETTKTLRDGIAATAGVHLLGRPHMSILAIASDVVDIYEVGDELTARGWHIDRQQNPACLHITVNRVHAQSANDFLEDLHEAVRSSRRSRRQRFLQRSQERALGLAARALPSPIVSRLTSVAGSLMGVGGGGLPDRTAAMYGMMATLPNRGDIQEIVIDALDGMTRPDRNQPPLLADPTDS